MNLVTLTELVPWNMIYTGENSDSNAKMSLESMPDELTG